MHVTGLVVDLESIHVFPSDSRFNERTERRDRIVELNDDAVTTPFFSMHADNPCFRQSFAKLHAPRKDLKPFSFTLDHWASGA